MLGEVFERSVEKSPISVMVCASLERVLGADRLDLWYERTAQKQYTRDLLLSSVYDMMNQVVFCVQPSVRAAQHAPMGSPRLNGLASGRPTDYKTPAAFRSLRQSRRPQ